MTEEVPGLPSLQDLLHAGGPPDSPELLEKKKRLMELIQQVKAMEAAQYNNEGMTMPPIGKIGAYKMAGKGLGLDFEHPDKKRKRKQRYWMDRTMNRIRPDGAEEYWDAVRKGDPKAHTKWYGSDDHPGKDTSGYRSGRDKYQPVDRNKHNHPGLNEYEAERGKARNQRKLDKLMSELPISKQVQNAQFERNLNGRGPSDVIPGRRKSSAYTLGYLLGLYSRRDV